MLSFAAPFSKVPEAMLLTSSLKSPPTATPSRTSKSQLHNNSFVFCQQQQTLPDVFCRSTTSQTRRILPVPNNLSCPCKGKVERTCMRSPTNELGNFSADFTESRGGVHVVWGCQRLGSTKSGCCKVDHFIVCVCLWPFCCTYHLQSPGGLG